MKQLQHRRAKDVIRWASATTVVVTLALGVPIAASADPPVKAPTPFPTVTAPAGVVCPFAVSWSSPAFNDNFQLTFFDKSGNVRWIWGGGHNVTRVTNLDNGKYVDINGTGPGKITTGTDGSLTIDGTGHWLVGYFPTDSPSLTTLLYSGHIVLHVSAEGQLTLVSYVGTAPQDVCAMIA
jgi:hypothetical protein